MCLTDILGIPNKKYFKKCQYFKKEKRFRKVSRSSSTAPILRSSFFKSATCSVYTLASLNSLINIKNDPIINNSQSSVLPLAKNNEISDTIYKHFEKNDIYTAGRTPLHEAAIAGQLSAIQWLLKYTCCSLNEKDADGCNILHLASRFNSDINILESAIRFGGFTRGIVGKRENKFYQYNMDSYTNEERNCSSTHIRAPRFVGMKA